MVKVIHEWVARIPPDCTESHCPSCTVVDVRPAPPVIRTINTRVPPGDASEVNMMPSLEQLVLWDVPVELLARIIHHKLSRAQGSSADEHPETSLPLERGCIDVDFEAEGKRWKIQVTAMPHGDEGGCSSCEVDRLNGRRADGRE